MRREPRSQSFRLALSTAGLLASLALLLGGCFPVLHSRPVPPVPEGVLPSTSFEDPLGEVLVLVLWQDETYRWSGSRTVRPSFLAPPHVVKVQELPQLERIAKKYRNYGVAAWDGHAGTVYQDKEPASLYLITSTGRIEWLVSLQDASTNWQLRWQRHAWTNLGETWRLRLHEVVGSCKSLTLTQGACGSSDTPFAASLQESDSELLVSWSTEQIELLRQFVTRLADAEVPAEEEVDIWQLYQGA